MRDGFAGLCAQQIEWKLWQKGGSLRCTSRLASRQSYSNTASSLSLRLCWPKPRSFSIKATNVDDSQVEFPLIAAGIQGLAVRALSFWCRKWQLQLCRLKSLQSEPEYHCPTPMPLASNATNSQ